MSTLAGREEVGARAGDAGGDPDEARRSRSWKGILHLAAHRGVELPASDSCQARTAVGDAARFGLQTVQCTPAFRAAGQDTEGEEDCLTLKVRAPAEPTAPTPVLFWFCGALPHGSGNLHDGARLAEVRDAVVETVNYRLDPPAFDNLAGLPPATPMSPADLAVTATPHRAAPSCTPALPRAPQQPRPAPLRATGPRHGTAPR